MRRDASCSPLGRSRHRRANINFMYNEPRDRSSTGRISACAQEAEGQYLDMDGTDALAFRVRSDGRKYIASLRTDNWIVGSSSHDVWQAFLFARCSSQQIIAPVNAFMTLLQV